MIRFKCPGCAGVLEVEARWAGHEITCGGCSRVVTVPRPKAAPRSRVARPAPAAANAPAPDAGSRRVQRTRERTRASPDAGKRGPFDGGHEGAMPAGICPRCGKDRIYGPGRWSLTMPLGRRLGQTLVANFACYHCGHVESYLGDPSTLQKLRTAWRRASAEGATGFLPGAACAGTCPKCASDRVYSGAALDPDTKKGEAIQRTRYTNAISLGMTGDAPIDNYVCAVCGFVDKYVADCPEMDRLVGKWPALLKDRKIGFTGQTLRNGSCPRCGGREVRTDSRIKPTFRSQIPARRLADLVDLHQWVCGACGLLERYLGSDRDVSKIANCWPKPRRIR